MKSLLVRVTVVITVMYQVGAIADESMLVAKMRSVKFPPQAPLLASDALPTDDSDDFGPEIIRDLESLNIEMMTASFPR